MDWLRANAGNDKFAAPGLGALPNLSVRYRVYDTRGVDVLLSPRLRTFWHVGDPGYDDSALYTRLLSPGEEWLAAAGVHWYMTSPGSVLPNTVVRYNSGRTVIAELPNSRPFAYGVISPSLIEVPNASAAASTMGSDPLGPVVVEGCCGTSPARASAPSLQPVTVLSRDQGTMTLRVTMPQDGVVVVLQSYAAGWSAAVDSHPVDIHPADVLFQAVSVPAGSHSITLRYWPTSFAVGMTVSAVSVIIVALLCGPAAWYVRVFAAVVALARGRRSHSTVVP